MSTIYVDLVLDSGELVRIECPDQFENELHEALYNCMKRKEPWSSGQFDGCHSTFMGMPINKVNMARVVGVI
jgi:hypothetical protein